MLKKSYSLIKYGTNIYLLDETIVLGIEQCPLHLLRLREGPISLVDRCIVVNNRLKGELSVVDTWLILVE